MLYFNRECSKHQIECLHKNGFSDKDGMLATRIEDDVCTICGKVWSQDEY